MPAPRSPLPPAAVHILVALGPGERHGYGIITEIAGVTGGTVRMAPGTLYVNIRRLLENGLIEETAARPDAGSDDERRRYYRLTTAGRDVVASEVARMTALVASTRAWLPDVHR